MKRIVLLVTALLSLLAGWALAQERPEGVEADGRMVVLYAMPRDADAIETTVMEVESVTCEEGVTTVNLGDAGSFSVGLSNRFEEPSYDIVIEFEQFDIFGGYRDIAMADQIELDWADTAMSGRYGFTLFGELAGNYGLDFDITCE